MNRKKTPKVKIVKKIQVMTEAMNSQEEKGQIDDSAETEKLGMPLKTLYRIAFNFFKEKSGKAIHLTYEDNLKLIAFTQQAKAGPFDVNTAPPLGVLDVIGRDRQVAWQSLGAISKIQAMDGFINLLDSLCPLFKPYIEAIKKNTEENLRIELEKKRDLQEAILREKEIENEQKKREEQQHKEEIQRRNLQDALNQQTYHQFMTYAEKQFPGNPEQQAVLIRQLQNEHYHQYMQQLHSQMKVNVNNETSSGALNESEVLNSISLASEAGALELTGRSNEDSILESSSGTIQEKNNSESDNEYVTLSPAKIWTRRDIKTFKKDVSGGSGDGVIHVGHGDTVTVRVPTHEGGKCIFWEFATDNYDIGFGVYFEWSKPVSPDVVVHVSESDDDEEVYDDEDDDEYANTSNDLECGPMPIHLGSISPSKPPISIIVPVYRRECQREVYVGSHPYPGEGVYLLKFDNSYSIWRSKTLYYRVYYER